MSTLSFFVALSPSSEDPAGQKHKNPSKYSAVLTHIYLSTCASKSRRNDMQGLSAESERAMKGDRVMCIRKERVLHVHKAALELIPEVHLTRAKGRLLESIALPLWWGLPVVAPTPCLHWCIVYMYVYVYAHICICVCMCMYVYMNVCMYIHTYVYECTHTHTHTHTRCDEGSQC